MVADGGERGHDDDRGHDLDAGDRGPGDGGVAPGQRAEDEVRAFVGRPQNNGDDVPQPLEEGLARFRLEHQEGQCPLKGETAHDGLHGKAAAVGGKEPGNQDQREDAEDAAGLGHLALLRRRGQRRKMLGAARLVVVQPADHVQRVDRRIPLRVWRRLTANAARRLLGHDFVGDRAKLRHRIERPPPRVVGDPGDEHGRAAREKLLDDRDQRQLEEVALIERDDIRALRVLQSGIGARHRFRVKTILRVRDEVRRIVPVVDRVLERLDRQTIGPRLAEPGDERFGLAREHRAMYNDEPAFGGSGFHGCDCARIERIGKQGLGDEGLFPVNDAAVHCARACPRWAGQEFIFS